MRFLICFSLLIASLALADPKTDILSSLNTAGITADYQKDLARQLIRKYGTNPYDLIVAAQEYIAHGTFPDGKRAATYVILHYSGIESRYQLSVSSTSEAAANVALKELRNMLLKPWALSERSFLKNLPEDKKRELIIDLLNLTDINEEPISVAAILNLGDPGELRVLAKDLTQRVSFYDAQRALQVLQGTLNKPTIVLFCAANLRGLGARANISPSKSLGRGNL